MVNSLTQVILKCTQPGIPDFYQGNEIWDFSLVDPDNRRAVDFDLREELRRTAESASFSELLKNWRDGRIKLRLTQGLLRLRAQEPRLFAQGDYRPAAGEGGFAHNVVAFTRTHETTAVLVVVPRLIAPLGSPPGGPGVG